MNWICPTNPHKKGALSKSVPRQNPIKFHTTTQSVLPKLSYQLQPGVSKITLNVQVSMANMSIAQDKNI